MNFWRMTFCIYCNHYGNECKGKDDDEFCLDFEQDEKIEFEEVEE